jgi:uncharacterized protein (DUF1697 family)
MNFVAFLRNVNLGQTGSPTRAQLERAFLQAGASEPASFMTNGTLVFSVARSRVAPGTARRAREILGRVCGLAEPVFVQSLPRLAQLVAADPFAKFDGSTISGRYISFFEPTAATEIGPPIETERKDCVIFRIGAGLALSITRDVDGRSGSPMSVLEKAIGAPATTRSWTTVLRLVRKHAEPIEETQ